MNIQGVCEEEKKNPPLLKRILQGAHAKSGCVFLGSVKNIVDDADPTLSGTCTVTRCMTLLGLPHVASQVGLDDG